MKSAQITFNDYNLILKSNRNYLQNRNRLTDIENKFWLPKGKGLREG